LTCIQFSESAAVTQKLLYCLTIESRIMGLRKIASLPRAFFCENKHEQVE